MCSTINTHCVVARGLQMSLLPQRQPLPVGVLRNRRQARRQMSPQVTRGRPETSPEQEFVHKIACARYVGEADSSILRSQRGSPRGRAPAVGPPSPCDRSAERLQQRNCQARDARFQRAQRAEISVEGCRVTANSLAPADPHLAQLQSDLTPTRGAKNARTPERRFANDA